MTKNELLNKIYELEQRLQELEGKNEIHYHYHYPQYQLYYPWWGTGSKTIDITYDKNSHDMLKGSDPIQTTTGSGFSTAS